MRRNETSWGNGMKINVCGEYKRVKINGKRFFAHRIVLHREDPREDETVLVVHHIDGNKSNNDPANLVWMTPEDHARLHHTGENHFRCDHEYNANYKHGLCVGGHSKEYKKAQNKKSYLKHRDERLARQNAYGELHRAHKRWYDKLRYWEKMLNVAATEARKEECINNIRRLKEEAI